MIPLFFTQDNAAFPIRISKILNHLTTGCPSVHFKWEDGRISGSCSRMASSVGGMLKLFLFDFHRWPAFLFTESCLFSTQCHLRPQTSWTSNTALCWLVNHFPSYFRDTLSPWGQTCCNLTELATKFLPAILFSSFYCPCSNFFVVYCCNHFQYKLILRRLNVSL